MIKGIGTSREGMAWEQARTDVVGNNIANINTDGFKRSVAVGSEFASILIHRLGDQTAADGGDPVIGSLGYGASLTAVVTDLTQGALQSTSSDLDLAIVGPGEFSYLGPTGPGYTRNGSFQIDDNGRLVTPQGHPVLVDGAPIGNRGERIALKGDGTVLVDGEMAGRLDIRGADASTRLVLRSLETANVDLTQEMTDLITAMRSFQVNQRALQMQDQTLSRAVSDLGNI